MTSAGGKQEEAKRRDWVDIAQTLAAFVAVPVALFYPVGLFTLFLQFLRYPFFLDSYTAWYAASLVNRISVVGKGATILIFTLVASVVLSAYFAKIFLKRKPSASAESGRLFVRDYVQGAKLASLAALALILFIAYSRIMVGGGVQAWFYLRGRYSMECSLERHMGDQLNLWPDSILPAFIFVVGCLIGGWVIRGSYLGYYERRGENKRQSPSRDDRLIFRFLKRGVTEGWLLSGLATAYAASVFASIVLSVYTPIFMPFMTYGDTVEYRGGKEPTNNTFLSHTEGQWYFLHRVERDKDNPRVWAPPEYIIVSLADAQAEHVRVRPNPLRFSGVAPLPLGLGVRPLILPNQHCEP